MPPSVRRSLSRTCYSWLAEDGGEGGAKCGWLAGKSSGAPALPVQRVVLRAEWLCDRPRLVDRASVAFRSYAPAASAFAMS